MMPRWIAAVALLAACSGERAPASQQVDTIAAAPAKPAPELALGMPNGVEVWFTDARTARDSSGATCIERVMQVRREGKEIAVPLLYTGAKPTPVNDSTVEAAIWLNCKPGNVYHVNLRTGYPTRVK